MSKKLLLLMLVAGCAAPQSRIQLPNGDMGYVLSCSGQYVDSGCYQQATNLCPGGYTVVSNDTSAVPYRFNYGYGNQNQVGGVLQKRSLMVTCD